LPSIIVGQEIVQHTTTEECLKLFGVHERREVAHSKLKVGSSTDRSFPRYFDHFSRVIKARNGEASAGKLERITACAAARIEYLVAGTNTVLAEQRDNSCDPRVDWLVHQ